MKVLNFSARPTKELTALVDWTYRKFRYALMAKLILEDADNKTTDGFSWKFDPFHKSLTPSLVLMKLGRHVKYPYQDKHYMRLGEIQVNDWKEEFVLVLAHELQHIEQYYALGLHFSDTPQGNYECEIDAELQAIHVLDLYRQNNV